MGDHVDTQTLITIGGAIATVLTGAIGVLFKLHYFDTKQSLADCEKRHEVIAQKNEKTLSDERAACEQRINQYQSVIDKLQSKQDQLQNQFFTFLQQKGNQQS